jgi:uncharacterized protein involved in cysteine biosynthesis
LEDGIVRLVKPVLVSLVAFGAVFWLTRDTVIAGTFALLPLLLGWLGIMVSLAYGLTGLALLAAVGSAVLPVSIKQDIASLYNETVMRISDGAGDGTTPADRAVPR